MSKFKVFKISESHEFKFKISESDEFKISNFNFYKKNTTPRTVWAFQGVSHFSNKCSSTIYTKSPLDLVGQFFQKLMLEGQKFQRREGEGDLHGWCQELIETGSNLSNLLFLTNHSCKFISRSFVDKICKEKIRKILFINVHKNACQICYVNQRTWIL